MNTITELGIKIAYAHARRRRILEGISSLNILATKEASLASAIAGNVKPAMRVSELLQHRGAQGLLEAAQAAKGPAMRVPKGPPPIPAAARKPVSPFSGNTPGAAPGFRPEEPISPEALALAVRNSGTPAAATAAPAQIPEMSPELAALWGQLRPKAASFSELIEMAKTAGAADRATALQPLLTRAGAGALLGGGIGAVEGARGAEEGETLQGALTGAGVGAGAGAIALPATHEIERALFRRLAAKTANVRLPTRRRP